MWFRFVSMEFWSTPEHLLDNIFLKHENIVPDSWSPQICIYDSSRSLNMNIISTSIFADSQTSFEDFYDSVVLLMLIELLITKVLYTLLRGLNLAWGNQKRYRKRIQLRSIYVPPEGLSRGPVLSCWSTGTWKENWFHPPKTTQYN